MAMSMRSSVCPPRINILSLRFMTFKFQDLKADAQKCEYGTVFDCRLRATWAKTFTSGAKAICNA